MHGDADRVPHGFHAVPDTDYEFSLSTAVRGEKTNFGVIWRRACRACTTFHASPAEEHDRSRESGAPCGQAQRKRFLYELAIPKSELADLKLQAGTDFGFIFKIGSGEGASVEYGKDKAVTKNNGLSLHPYGESHSNSGVRWKLVN